MLESDEHLGSDLRLGVLLQNALRRSGSCVVNEVGPICVVVNHDEELLPNII